MRTDETFKRIFEAVEQQYGETIEKTRINARQTNCENHPVDSAEEYYRRSMCFPYLDICSEQLREIFAAQTVTAYALSHLLTLYVIDATMRTLRASVERTIALFQEVRTALRLS